MSGFIKLPAVLDIQQAEPLRAQLLGMRGTPVTLDGSEVERLGALCLQVLISAQQTWARDEQSLILDRVSEDFANQWNAFGAEAIEQGVAA